MPKTPSTVFASRAASKSGAARRIAGQPNTRSDWVLSGINTCRSRGASGLGTGGSAGRGARAPTQSPNAAGDLLHAFLGGQRADDRHDHILRPEVRLIEAHQGVPVDRRHRSPVAQQIAPEGVRAEHQLSEGPPGHLARVVLPLRDGGHAQAADLLHVLGRKDRIAQLVHQDIQHQVKILGQRLRGEADDVAIGAEAD